MGAHVGLEDAKVAAGLEVVDPLGNGPDHLNRHVSRLALWRRQSKILPLHFTPAPGEVVGHVGDRRAAHLGQRVVPAEVAAHRVFARVEAVAPQGCQVHASHEGPLSVDDHELLVVAVHGPLAVVQRALHPRPADELVSFAPYSPPRGFEDRQRCTGPEQDPHLHALGQLAQQVSQPPRVALAREPEVGRQVPAGDVDVGAGVGEGRGDGR